MSKRHEGNGFHPTIGVRDAQRINSREYNGISRQGAATGRREQVGGLAAVFERQGERHHENEDQDSAVARRDSRPGSMVEPGMVIEDRVGWVSRKHTQLMVEQYHRQG
ncbi:hypothetical protein FBQ96_03630 [Nitrospirales bacterium NOB]|nr:hypothetical protein [Nitrospirales bacterium NOB]